MDEPHGQPGAPKQGPALAGGLIEGPRTLAAAGDENLEDRSARLGSDAEEFFPNRQAGGFGPAFRKEFRGLREGNERAGDETADDAIREAWNGIGLHDHH